MSPETLVSRTDLLAVLPETILTVAGVLILLVTAAWSPLRRLATPAAVLAALLAGYASWAWVPSGASFRGLLEATAVTQAAGLVVLLSAVLALLASQGYLAREGILEGEYHALFLWCATGMLLMVRATELLTVFLALELLSICLYALAGYHRRLALATEAAVKYFLMGAFVSAFVLYGLALLYGETGSTRLDEITVRLTAGDSSSLTSLGLLLLVAGFGFKMSLVPFHAWSPDTYQGAPSPFVAFLSVAPKAASAIVLVRLLEVALAGDPAGRWPALVGLLAILCMVAGNLLALVQRDIKRMLAYSGIAHMGYLLIPLAALEPRPWTPVLVYLLAYALMNAGAFAVVGMLYPRPGEQHLISDLSGWGSRYPLLAFCLTVCMLSLGGIPPTLGFFGKYLVFAWAVEHGLLHLALVGIATSLVGIFYYLRVVYVLYMKPEIREPEGTAVDGWGRTAAVLAAAGTLLLGIWPSGAIEWLEGALTRLP